jgi:hypothetical protein
MQGIQVLTVNGIKCTIKGRKFYYYFNIILSTPKILYDIVFIDLIAKNDIKLFDCNLRRIVRKIELFVIEHFLQADKPKLKDCLCN